MSSEGIAEECKQKIQSVLGRPCNTWYNTQWELGTPLVTVSFKYNDELYIFHIKTEDGIDLHEILKRVNASVRQIVPPRQYVFYSIIDPNCDYYPSDGNFTWDTKLFGLGGKKNRRSKNRKSKSKNRRSKNRKSKSKNNRRKTKNNRKRKSS